jgi:hypothetical protein
MSLLTWDIYEIRCDSSTLHGVKLRGRIRKFTIESELSCLVENASDEDNVVRFALPIGTNPDSVSNFVKTLVPEAIITEPLKAIPNPVLSKIKVNDQSRYDI